MVTLWKFQPCSQGLSSSRQKRFSIAFGLAWKKKGRSESLRELEIAVEILACGSCFPGESGVISDVILFRVPHQDPLGASFDCFYGYFFYVADNEGVVVSRFLSIVHFSDLYKGVLQWKSDTWRLLAKYGTIVGLNGRKEVQEKRFWPTSLMMFPAMALYQLKTFFFALFLASFLPFCDISWRQQSSR